MKRLVIVALMATTVSRAGAETPQPLPFPTNALVLSFSQPRYFTVVTRTGNSITVQMPLTAEPFNAFLNGKDLGLAGPDLKITLAGTDQLRLKWKRTTILVQPDTNAIPSELRMVRVHEGLDGRGATTNFFIVREDKRRTDANDPVEGTR